jgi:thioredoxin 1
MKQITAADFEAEVLRSKQPVLVDFYTDSCAPCRMMSPLLQELEAEAGGQFKVFKVDAAAEIELAATYGVRAVPAFYAFANGQCVGQTVGAKSKANMKKWFDDSIRTVAAG